MSEDEFTKLFKYVQRIEQKLDTQIENMATKDDMQRIFNILDKIEKRLEITEDEQLVMGRQLDRMDRWIHELADKVGHKLSI